jgi:hypothetical protein
MRRATVEVYDPIYVGKRPRQLARHPIYDRSDLPEVAQTVFRFARLARGPFERKQVERQLTLAPLIGPVYDRPSEAGAGCEQFCLARARPLNVCSVATMTSLSSPLQAVISLFSGPLQGVRFADIDAEGLSSLAAEVESLGSEVETLDAQLTNLREALAQKQEALLALAQQALAYARIYAESDEALTAELNEIALPRATKPRKGGSMKPSERGAKAPKEDVDNTTDRSLADAEVNEVEPAAPTKSRRKAAAAAEEPKAEVEAPAPAGRRKLPARTGRAAR